MRLPNTHRNKAELDPRVTDRIGKRDLFYESNSTYLRSLPLIPFRLNHPLPHLTAALSIDNRSLSDSQTRPLLPTYNIHARAMPFFHPEAPSSRASVTCHHLPRAPRLR